MLKRVVALKTFIGIMAFFLTASLGLAATAKTEQKDKVSKDDASFMKEAAEGGMMEVQLGKLAGEKASSKQVKEFGQRMLQDHSKANEALKKLAANKGVKLPTTLEGKHKSAVDRLSKLSGDEFDREYMRLMVDDHKEDVEKFESQAKKADDPDVKKFASQHAPILKKHLELAQSARKQVASSNRGAASGKAGK
jgi:putative membrane protein